MTTYQIGTSIATLANVDTVCGILPRSRYSPGKEIETHAGTRVYRGYPRSVWTFDALTVAVWDTLKNTYLGGDLSGETYVTTRDDEDDWDSYRVIARLPTPDSLQRWGGRYLDIEIELILVEAP
jgi:hypothetical protein